MNDDRAENLPMCNVASGTVVHRRAGGFYYPRAQKDIYSVLVPGTSERLVRLRGAGALWLRVARLLAYAVLPAGSSIHAYSGS